jgi:hypothetical protein
MPRGLVEVLYTLDGAEWKSLGFVEKENFGDASFEIPIEEAAAWEDISRIQIGVQSVPAIDTTRIIYLDSVWIEVEYEHVGDSQLATVLGAMLPDESADVATSTEETELDEEDASLEEEEEGEEEQEEELSHEETPPEERVAEPESHQPHLSTRHFDKHIVVDPKATHACAADPFRIDVSGRDSVFTKLTLNRPQSGDYELEIGGLPEGIDVRFSKNKSYTYRPETDETEVFVLVSNEQGSRRGDFNIPIIFTKKAEHDSTAICQANVVNL